MSKAPAYKALDLFAGCGGLTQGLRRAGFQVVGAVEIDPLAAKAYKLNHPDAHVWRRDIRSLSVPMVLEKLNLARGQLDLLAGCPPCQGFSSIQTLNGGYEVDDDRNDLIHEFFRFVKGMLPRAIMMENVPGLAKDARWEAVKDKLEDIGYELTHDVLDTADYGVPQRRRRFILLGSLDGEVPFARRARVSPTVRSAIMSLPKPTASTDELHKTSGGRRTRRILNLIKAIPKDGGSRSDLPRWRQLECHKRVRGFYDVYGRMAWDDVAPTITGGCLNPSKGRFLHPEQDRPITLREAALLQTFPPNYKLPLTRGHFAAAVLIGNALPPEFICRHAKSIRRMLERRE